MLPTISVPMLTQLRRVILAVQIGCMLAMLSLGFIGAWVEHELDRQERIKAADDQPQKGAKSARQ